MKIIVKFLAVAFLLIAGLSTAHAQRGGWNADPEERAKQQTTQMTDVLSLSDKQAEKVGEINLKYASKMSEARAANQDEDWTAMRETIMKLRQEQQEELKGVMTSEQFETWTKHQEEQRQNRRNRRGERGKEKKTEDKNG